MKNRMGRPIVGDKKSETMRFRCSEKDREVILTAAEIRGIPYADLIRKEIVKRCKRIIKDAKKSV